MFVEKEIIRKIVNDLMEFAENRRQGDSITIMEIAEVSGLTPYGEHWATVIIKFKNRMRRERSQVLWSVEPGAYKILEEKEKVTVAAFKRRRKMFRQSSRAMAELGTVDATKLTDHERQIYTRQIERYRAERKMLRSSMKDTKPHRSDAHPKRPVPHGVG